MQKQSKITSKGQITVPIEVRRLLGVRAGDRCFSRATATAYISGPFATTRKAHSPNTRHRQSRHPSGKKAINRWLREVRGHND